MPQTLKVRKIGNSFGVILPKETGFSVGDELTFTQKGTKVILDSADAARLHDKKIIEEAFQDFENQQTVTEAQMKARFGKYGWQ